MLRLLAWMLAALIEVQPIDERALHRYMDEWEAWNG